jgi:hypothetical protein
VELHKELLNDEHSAIKIVQITNEIKLYLTYLYFIKFKTNILIC